MGIWSIVLGTSEVQVAVCFQSCCLTSMLEGNLRRQVSSREKSQHGPKGPGAHIGGIYLKSIATIPNVETLYLLHLVTFNHLKSM